MVTLKEVADLAGVSEATASLSLSGGQVKESTRERVIECAKRLNYVPNRSARILTTGKTNAIALVILTSTRHVDTVHQTALFYYLIEGVHAIADSANYSLRFDAKSHEDPSLMSYFEKVIGDRSLDGIIIVPQFLCDYPFIGLLQKHSFPYVILRSPRFGDSVNFVDMDNYRGAQMVANLFKEIGYQKLALINGPESHVDAIERERGFLDALGSSASVRFTKSHGDFTIASGIAGMKSILKEFRPEAVFCANDYMAAGAMKVIHESGLRIPEDIAVIGYDNTDICIGTIPDLTTVDNHFEELGKSLAGGLLQLIDNRTDHFGTCVRASLVLRGSHAAKRSSSGRPGRKGSKN